jgi:hypothetical protein
MLVSLRRAARICRNFGGSRSNIPAGPTFSTHASKIDPEDENVIVVGGDWFPEHRRSIPKDRKPPAPQNRMDPKLRLNCARSEYVTSAASRAEYPDTLGLPQVCLVGKVVIHVAITCV